MALVQSVSAIPTTTTVVASTLNGLCSTGKVFTCPRSEECDSFYGKLPKRKRLREDTKTVPVAKVTKKIKESVHPENFDRQGAKNNNQPDNSKIEKTLPQPSSISMNIPYHQTAPVMVPVISVPQQVAWPTTVTPASLPQLPTTGNTKEVIIANTNFKITSALAQRRMLRQQRLQSSLRNKSQPVKSEDTTSRQSEAITTMLSRSSCVTTNLSETPPHKKHCQPISRLSSNQTCSVEQSDKNIQNSLQHHKQLVNMGGVTGPYPLTVMHNHSQSHLTHFAGNWTGQMLPQLSQDNKEDTRLSTLPVQQGSGYQMVYMVPGPPYMSNPNMFIGSPTSLLNTQVHSKPGSCSSSNAVTSLHGSHIVINAPQVLTLPQTWPSVGSTPGGNAAAAGMVTGTLPSVPLLVPQMMQPTPSQPMFLSPHPSGFLQP